jgi:hypothetical protein
LFQCPNWEFWLNDQVRPLFQALQFRKRVPQPRVKLAGRVRSPDCQLMQINSTQAQGEEDALASE